MQYGFEYRIGKAYPTGRWKTYAVGHPLRQELFWISSATMLTTSLNAPPALRYGAFLHLEPGDFASRTDELQW